MSCDHLISAYGSGEYFIAEKDVRKGGKKFICKNTKKDDRINSQTTKIFEAVKSSEKNVDKNSTTLSAILLSDDYEYQLRENVISQLSCRKNRFGEHFDEFNHRII